MADVPDLKQKVMLFLYGLGMKGTGPELARSLPKKSAEWKAFVFRLFASDADVDSREAALKLITSSGFIDKHPARKELIDLLVKLLGDGIGKERHIIIKFLRQKLELFPTDSDFFRMRVIGLQRSGDPELSNAADEILAKIGLDMRDPELFKTGR